MPSSLQYRQSTRHAGKKQSCSLRVEGTFAPTLEKHVCLSPRPSQAYGQHTALCQPLGSAMKEGVAEYMLAVLELSEKLMLTFLPVAGQDSWIPAGPVLKITPPSRDRSQMGDRFPGKHFLVLCLLPCSAWTLSLTAGPPLQPTPTALKLTSLPMMSPG